MHLSWLCHLDTAPPKNTHFKDILNLDICEGLFDAVERHRNWTDQSCRVGSGPSWLCGPTWHIAGTGDTW